MIKCSKAGIADLCRGVFFVLGTLFASGVQAAPDWSVVCDDGDGCALAQTVYAPDRTWLATIGLHHPQAESGTTQVQFLVPAGVHLGSGLFWVGRDQEPVGVDWISCTAQACRAAGALTPDQISHWRKARAVDVVYRPNSSAPPLRFSISLNGVTAGLAQLERPR